MVRYKSSTDGDPSRPRKVRVALVDPMTGEPLEIVDSKGKIIRPKVVAEETYTPSTSHSPLESSQRQRSG